jgi:DNA-binding NarL/FixJ family response regulator
VEGGHFFEPNAQAAQGSDLTPGAVNSRPPPAQLVLAVEIRLYREGLSQALSREPEIEVLATSRNCAELEDCLRDIHPQVLVVDSGMTGWLETTHALTPPDETRVVVLGVRGVPDEVVTLAEAGIAGYVTRDEPFDRLVEVIICVARGEMPCSPQVSGHLMRRLALLAAGLHDAPLTRLTAREHEVLELIERGLQNKQIARTLSIELATVKNHVRSILDKLEVHTRGEAAAVSRRRG